MDVLIKNNIIKKNKLIVDIGMFETKVLEAHYEAKKITIINAKTIDSKGIVDENGLVTAKGVGSVIITAADSEGTTGGIKVVVQSEEIPYFENLQFLSSAIKDYSTVYAFAPTTTDYNLDIKTYSTSKLTLQNTTLFDDEKYNAVAEYTDINGEKQSVSINSGAITYLDGIPFDESKVTITLSDKSNLLLIGESRSEKSFAQLLNFGHTHGNPSHLVIDGALLTARCRKFVERCGISLGYRTRVHQASLFWGFA